MHEIMVNGRWINDVNGIKQETWNFFKDKFHETHSHRPALLNLNIKQISETDKIFLESSFDLDEVKEAIWNCGSEKAPGPDGFNFTFIKHFWLVMQDDIMRFIKHFEAHGSLARGSNSSFITLLPKVKDPLILSDYTPISLIGSLYKIRSSSIA